VTTTVHSAVENDAADSQLLQEVLYSKCFQRTTALRKLLRYLWENRENDVSEYAIAIDALGRDRDFDSKIDATVRVQIGRLRSFLGKYYEIEGRHISRRLTIPVGSHQLLFADAAECEVQEDNGGAGGFRDALPLEPIIVSDPLRVDQRRPPISIQLSIILTALVTCIIMFLLPVTRLSGKNAAIHKEPPALWKRFFDNGKAIRIVLPAPLFFSWQPEGSGSLMVRDISVNVFERDQDSPQLTELERRLGKPHRWQNYTVASDTFASIRLARFLDSYGIATSFSSSADSPHGIIDHENVITFGTATSLAAYQSELDRLSFKMGPHERFVIDQRLPVGGAPLFPKLVEAGSREVTPGIVALLPRGGSSDGRILIIQGSQTTALISYLTSDEGMREIAKAIQGSSPYFEAVILSEVNEGNPIQSRLAVFRPFIPVALSPQRAELWKESVNPSR
jgi:hypothetical protein